MSLPNRCPPAACASTNPLAALFDINHHQLALLLSLGATMLINPDLPAILLYWLARPVAQLTRPPRVLLPPANGGGLPSPYWATVHALRWPAPGSVRAARTLLVAYPLALALVLLAAPAPLTPAAEEAVLAAVGSALGQTGLAYLHVAIGCVAARLAGWGAWGLVAWLVEVVIEVVKELALFWAGVLCRYWSGIIVGVSSAVLIALGREVGFWDVARDTVEWCLLLYAGWMYWIGDGVRDVAGWLAS
ncbi:bcd2fd88-4db7-4b4c-83f0-05e1c67027f0 [Thermothielavioides terrestris]|uniref:Uncharacterized protein n=2 Tax=Thermothielavioides terrestris TaxID=2587410 RepID=G2R137_THETT|nr:uncharacterized protein THITE_2088014 [Thermothielavioides terrestris NRRL 8126]AEO66534.1 hypothetical protein THITE_2088014 [Thermothielavioides terrestris NRRL 8126]SPQ20234.1 bcd2fd88-4db7-4b4c-83f0-05e1c67027f0 [Thermothielavioides terrestris]